MNFFSVEINKAILEILSRRAVPLRPNILTSIYRMTPRHSYLLQKYQQRGIINMLALDSGTYSLNAALKNGKRPKVDIDTLFNRFVFYAKANQEKYSIVFNFDLDYSPAGYEVNMRFLEKLHKARIDAWPVIHDPVGRDYENYVAKGFTKMAIGQCEDRDLNVINSIISDLNNLGITQIHILGVASPKILPETMAWSADASSPVMHAAVGQLRFWNYDGISSPVPGTIKIPKRVFSEPQTGVFRHAKEMLMSWLDRKESHIKWEDLRGNQQSYFMTIVNMLFYDELATLATERQKLRQRRQQAEAC